MRGTPVDEETPSTPRPSSETPTRAAGQATPETPPEAVADTATRAAPKRTGLRALKTVFALEYVMQGLANPFQGITYQPFFKHFRFDYGMTEAATQALFAKSYLAWSFKPLLGFLIDAYGRTRTLLIGLLSTAAIGYFVAPWFDTSALVFFWFMFGLSIVLATTDVAVDRATVIAGDEESKATGRSKATTVGLNQAICWTAIYGTSIFAAVAGGYIADNVPTSGLLLALGAVPLMVLAAVWFVPKDRATPVPVSRSLREFWRGLNSGPILGVMLFYFIFHFQPALGPLWNNYLLEDLAFTQTEVGISDGASYAGYFIGVLVFAWRGVKWQERIGLQKLFRVFILLSIATNLTQYLLVDPTFSSIAGILHTLLPFDEGTVRLLYLCAYNFCMATARAVIQMSTFSLVGAVVPVAAAGSLFAGFMSVANLAYSFSYASGAWLYDNGMRFGVFRTVQDAVFGIAGSASSSLAIETLIFIGSIAYVLSFGCVHLLPDRRATAATEVAEDDHPGPERWDVLPAKLRKAIDGASLFGGAAVFGVATYTLGLDIVAAALLSLFGVTLVRKAVLDALLRRQ
jgi:MFS family permease